MSLFRYYLNDPFFNPDAHAHHHLARQRRNAYDSLLRQQESVFNAFDELFNSPLVRSPPVELREEDNAYVVDAELPGVRKEDLDIRVGEGGRSLTIEGRVFRRTGGGGGEEQAQPSASVGPAEGEAGATSPAPANGDHAKDGTVARKDKNAVGPASNAEQTSTYSSTFSRTFQFPRPVDGSKVSARLDHGILSLRIPQLEDTKSVRVNVE